MIKKFIGCLMAAVAAVMVGMTQYAGAAYEAFATSTIDTWISDTVDFVSAAVQSTVTSLFQTAAGPLLLLALTIAVFYWIYRRFKGGVK